MSCYDFFHGLNMFSWPTHRFMYGPLRRHLVLVDTATKTKTNTMNHNE